MKKTIMLLAITCLLVACQPAPQPLSLGQDVCAHCKMTIVDEQFAAELVTTKSKVFKFDAIECMMAFLKENDQSSYALYLVRDFESPNDWQDATTSSYLISKEIPSPMGGYLSAWNNEQNALRMQANKGGEVHTWAEIVTLFEE
ncbi:MAG: nitrous oxide reductase accessory protein NosL [Saprospiraceae bacterium]|nr:nitrous oxide reductase accessory protein NosL [Saprospiraceae bacterium]MCF8249174.1 nitrous oxide reductase accessory protein NosL [Saprospiraceae bacterium]MCF8311303.1 nitrous oxide reductase accessory protein NosL [Saprospiraceae bacterium]MCF8440133.1 nitrous oxide reductase accessory protein NosL [Saprospiraceae bacterium]